MSSSRRVSVLGAGAWGTALAIHARRRGHDVTLWARDAAHAAVITSARENRRQLPGARLPDGLAIQTDLAASLAASDLVVLAVPASATASVAHLAAVHLAEGAAFLSTAKGLEPLTSRRLSVVLCEILPVSARVAVLSGPSFAAEVAAGQPTAVVIAAESLDVARDLQSALSGPSLRVYASQDLAGVELCGALKNVIAIAAGLASGLGHGANAQAALVTRGLVEIGALASALGAQRETITGLAGLGDLVLTCTGAQSRNRRLGEAVGRGATLTEALASLGHVAEGVGTTGLALALAREQQVTLPIAECVDAVLAGRLPAGAAMTRLMGRALRDETP